MVEEKCTECGMPLEQESDKCSCEPSLCHYCCKCEPGCECGCKKKEEE